MGIALFDQIPKMDESSVLVKRLDGMTKARRCELLALLDEFVQSLPCSEKIYFLSESETREESTASRSKRVVNECRACVLLLGPTCRVQLMAPGPFAEAHYWELMKSIRALN